MNNEITLVKRNINCSNITAEEFITSMFSDFLEAQEKYNDLYIPEWEYQKVANFESRIEYVRKNATKIAEKKWKTEKYRNKFINESVEKARKEYKFDTYYYDLGFFDFKVTPGEMGISGNCCIGYKELTPKALRRCFEEIKDNKYFKQAHGWMLTYVACNNSYQSCSRPQIKLIVDDNVAAQMKKDADDLANSVANFYKGCTYWGD